MKHSVLVRSVVSVALISASAFAHANGTHEQFVDPAASLSFDGWNELNRNLESLSGTQDFRDTLSALTATVQLLSGRVNNSVPAPHVELGGAKKRSTKTT